MSNPIGILTVHGMGKQDSSYADEFENNIRTYLDESLQDKIFFEKSIWSGILDTKEKKFKSSISDFDLAYGWLRDFVLFYLGDVVAYQKSSGVNGEIYRGIHETIMSSLTNLISKVGDDGSILFVGHSLGSVIISDFVWDLQHKDKSGLHSKVVGAVTMGSPLAVYSLAYDAPKSMHIKNSLAPRSGVPHWLNIYSITDILAYPVGSTYINPTIDIEDRQMAAGNILKRWNPLSHSEYFGSKNVAINLAEHLTFMLDQ